MDAWSFDKNHFKDQQRTRRLLRSGVMSLKLKGIVLMVALAAFLLVDRIAPWPDIEAVTSELARLLALLAVASVLLTPEFSGRHSPSFPVAFWTLTYLVCKTVGGSAELAWTGEVDLPTVLYETTALAIIIGMAVALMQSLRSWYQLSELMFLADLEGVPSLVEADSPESQRCIGLARRHGDPVTAMLVSLREDDLAPAEAKAIENALSHIGHRLLSWRLAAAIGSSLRRTDLLVSTGKHGKLVILCPESSKESLGRLAERIKKNVKTELKGDVAFGMATFPDDALFIQDLLVKAEADLLECGSDSQPPEPMNKSAEVDEFSPSNASRSA